MANVESSSTELLRAQAHIYNQTFHFKNSASLKCAVQLGIPDVIHKHGNPITLSDLTSALPINPSKAVFINRLMRILVNAGVFAQEKEGYALTSAGRLLVKDEIPNERGLVMMVLDPAMVKPWDVLSEWFQNDDPTPFYTAHGKNFWDYNAAEPKFSKMLNEEMANDSQLITKVLVTECTYVFEGLTSLVDVGGGTGTVARAIAKSFPNLKCTVLDLPHVVANQEGHANLDFVAGDMLDKVPNANAILLKGEKLLGSLGVISSNTWKPKKTRPITGRFVKRDDPTYRNGSHLEQREKLGLTSTPQGRSNTRAQAPEPTNALQKVEVEKLKQDDALSDLSNILGELKKMAIDMGSEIDRQKPGLDALTYDVEEINNRVKGANQRARRLLGK